MSSFWLPCYEKKWEDFLPEKGLACGKWKFPCPEIVVSNKLHSFQIRKIFPEVPKFINFFWMEFPFILNDIDPFLCSDKEIIQRGSMEGIYCYQYDLLLTSSVPTPAPLHWVSLYSWLLGVPTNLVKRKRKFCQRLMAS